MKRIAGRQLGTGAQVENLAGSVAVRGLVGEVPAEPGRRACLVARLGTCRLGHLLVEAALAVHVLGAGAEVGSADVRLVPFLGGNVCIEVHALTIFCLVLQSFQFGCPRPPSQMRRGSRAPPSLNSSFSEL